MWGPSTNQTPAVSRQLGMALPHRGRPCLNSGVASSPAERLSGLVFGYMPAQLVHVMARLGLADVLVDQQISVEELSVSVGAETDMMRRLLRGLAGLGLVELAPDDRVSLTEMGGFLAAEHPASMRSTALHAGGESFRAWTELEHGVRTGAAPFQAAHGDSFFEFLRKNPAAGAAFDGMMSQLSRRVIREAVATYEFEGASRILDVAGGRGHFVAAVLGAHPDLRGAVFDVPEAVPEARVFIAGKGLSDRCEVIGGSFFDAVPTGFDVHILKWILHDWNDAACQNILENCRAALPEHGHVLVVEQLLPDTVTAGSGLHPAVAMDLNMLVNFGDARERTLQEYESLLAGGGLVIDRVIELPFSRFSILDCRPEHASVH
jgi:hypothetical protein